MYHLLFEREGFQLWWVHPNAARAPGQRMHPALRRLPYARQVWEAGAAPMAWEIALVRREGARAPMGLPSAGLPTANGMHQGEAYPAAACPSTRARGRARTRVGA